MTNLCHSATITSVTTGRKLDEVLDIRVGDKPVDGRCAYPIVMAEGVLYIPPTIPDCPNICENNRTARRISRKLSPLAT